MDTTPSSVKKLWTSIVSNLSKFSTIDFQGAYSHDSAVETQDITQAMTINSNMEKGPWEHTVSHKVVLDIDVPAVLIPSSSPSHSHLYIDKDVPWPLYEKLLRVLAECGIIEEGYAGASIEREYTTLRTPWTIKEGHQKDGDRLQRAKEWADYIGAEVILPPPPEIDDRDRHDDLLDGAPW